MTAVDQDSIYVVVLIDGTVKTFTIDQSDIDAAARDLSELPREGITAENLAEFRAMRDMGIDLLSPAASYLTIGKLGTVLREYVDLKTTLQKLSKLKTDLLALGTALP